jgi:signal peptidase I
VGTSQRRGLAGILVLAVLVLFWVFFAPVQLGGRTYYSATVGTSMQPLFHKGDLAIVHRSSSYRVGDIVLYESAILHRPVLHRIIVIQNGHYFFKGDNNDFVDPGYATSNELLGKLWLHIPKAGRILGWFGAPTHTALLGGLAAAFLFMGGSRKGKRRRRRSGTSKRPAGITKRPAQTSPGVKRMPAFFHRPRKSAENIIGGLALLLAAVVVAAGFGAPLARTVSVTGFHQRGTFSYHAKTLHPSNSYPTGTVSSGQPIYLSLIKNMSVAFRYRFDSNFAHSVHGTVTLKALVSSSGAWQHLYTLEKTKAFTGDTARVAGTFDLTQLVALTSEISTEAGTPGVDYTIQLEPTVHVTGRVDGQRISSTFLPILPFTLSPTALDLSIPQTAAPPGATYTAPTAAQTLATGLNPTQPGTVSAPAPNHLSFVRYHLAVSSVRGLGLALAGIAVLAFLAKLMKPRREVWSHEKRIAVRYGVVMVDVTALTDGASSLRTTIIPDFESLAKLAQYCERPILRDTHEEQLAYAVEDEGRLYVHRPAPTLVHPVAGKVEAEAS